MTESTTHQLFATSTLHTKYPDYFTNSTNQKYVSVIAVHLFKDDATTNAENPPQTDPGLSLINSTGTTLTTPTGNIAIDPETGERIHDVKCGTDVCRVCGEKVNDPDGTGVDQTTGIKIYINHPLSGIKCSTCGKIGVTKRVLGTMKASDYVPPTPPEETTPEVDSTFSILQYCQLHASFVQDDECLDQYVCMANLPLYHKRKYKQYNNPRFFDVWFTDYKGTKIEFDSTYHFVLELLLEY